MNRRAVPESAVFRPVFPLAIIGALLALLLTGCDFMGAGTPPLPAGSTAAPTATAPPPPASATPAPPSATPLPPTETPIPPSPTPQPRSLSGHVLDSYSGHPVSGAQITAGGASVSSDGTGTYDLGVVAPGTQLRVTAPGYAPATADSGTAPSLDVPLRPATLRGHVTDASTGKPLHGVIVRIDLTPAAAPPVTATQPVTPNGALPAIYAASAFSVLADETPAATGDVSGTQALPPATPLPPSATPTPAPIMPTPFANDKMILAVTDANGDYQMDNVPQNPTLTFKMPGYKLTKTTVGRTSTQDQALQPFAVKALYMTASVADYPPLYDPIMQLADTTNINAIVLNIQDDNSRVVYDTKVPLAISSGATTNLLPNIKDVIATFHKHGLYVIGRVLTFMQPAVAEANPNLAVISKATGKPWHGGELGTQRWLDPTNPAARQYPLALAKEAVTLGFDEIQFDYIRFPSDPAPGEKWDNMTFSQTADDTTKPMYIQQFESEAHDMLNQTDAFMGVDVFGYTIWPDEDGEPVNASIGQDFNKMIGNTDYMDPMIYPSHFSAGEGGFDDPNAHPYEIIKRAGEFMQARNAGQRAVYRPWLQGFDWNHKVYDGPVMEQQEDAAAETGAVGYMFWDPSNIYYDGFK